MGTIKEDISDILDQLIRRMIMFSDLTHPKDRERVYEIITEVMARSGIIMTEANEIMSLCDEFNELTKEPPKKRGLL